MYGKSSLPWLFGGYGYSHTYSGLTVVIDLVGAPDEARIMHGYGYHHCEMRMLSGIRKILSTYRNLGDT